MTSNCLASTSPPLRWLMWFVCLSVVIPAAVHSATYVRADEEPAIDDVVRHWQKQQDAVKTARVEGWYLFYINTGRVAEGKKKLLSREELNELLRKIESAAETSGVDDVIQAISEFPYPLANPTHEDNSPWTFRLICKDRRFRNSTFTSSGKLEKEACFDGEHSFAYYPDETGGQLNVGVSVLFGLSDLRTLLSGQRGKLGELTGDRWALAWEQSDGSHTRKSISQLDKSTFTVLSSDVFHNDRIISMTRHFKPVDCGHGVHMPLVTVHSRYRSSGDISSVSIMCIQKLELNGPVDDGVFQMSVPADTVLVDYRQSRRDPKTRKFPFPIDDPVAILDKKRGEAGDPPRQSP